MRIESDARSHEGKVRAVNEDSFFAAEQIGVWAVADGMGGHERGEWASERLIEAFEAIDGTGGFEGICAAIPDRIRAANAAIFAEAQARGQQMGSTIVALAVHGARYCIFWVGDSRAYLLRGGKLIRLTRDHTQVQQMVDRGLMEPGDIEGHPMGHVLSRAVGVQPEVEVEEATGRVEPGDTFLLCSDGLHGYVAEADIARILARGSPQEVSEKLVQTTLGRGAPDNVTVITISVSEPTLLTLPEPVKAS